MTHSHRFRRPPIATSLALPVLLGLLGTCVPVHASAPTEKVVCTDTPRSQWMSEARAREIFGASRYVAVKFKISKGNCHEFYAVDAQGGVVEAYLHPVTGQEVRATRIPAGDKTPAAPDRQHQP
ncbi:MAG: PepSY domain-containing protein [Giesbergeria sp.]|jgi:hypothetical protein|nr:PepSY domain-containing protein [Giesbergeria sp.]